MMRALVAVLAASTCVAGLIAASQTVVNVVPALPAVLAACSQLAGALRAAIFLTPGS